MSKQKTICAVMMMFAASAANGQTWYVDDDNCPGPGSGTQEDPFCTIQSGINAAGDGNVVVVAQGTYVERINMLGKAITLRSTAPTDPAVVAATIIDGNAGGTVITCTSGETAGTVIDGLTITNGNAPFGGGMYISGSEPVVFNCTFDGNTAEFGGGMANVEDSVVFVWNCTFSGNTADSGAGMANVGTSNAVVLDCTFRENSALSWGGGVCNLWSSPAVVGCTFSGNSADNDIPDKWGGGIGEGGGLYNSFSDPTLTNCIFWGNTAPDGPQIWDSGDTAIVTYSCIEGGWTGTGNIDADPLFSAGPDGCFYLSQTAAGLPFDSPCLDAGSDTAANLGLDTMTTRRDEVGDAGMVDMGYHYPVTGLPFIHGDFDRDGDLDLDDFSEWTAHVTGPCPAEPCWPTAYPDPCGNIADFNDDGDVDLHGWGAFQAAFTGPLP